MDAAAEMTDDDKEKLITNQKAHEEVLKTITNYV